MEKQKDSCILKILLYMVCGLCHKEPFWPFKVKFICYNKSRCLKLFSYLNQSIYMQIITSDEGTMWV